MLIGHKSWGNIFPTAVQKLISFTLLAWGKYFLVFQVVIVNHRQVIPLLEHILAVLSHDYQVVLELSCRNFDCRNFFASLVSNLGPIFVV